jgi:TPR repeat protein
MLTSLVSRMARLIPGTKPRGGVSDRNASGMRFTMVLAAAAFVAFGLDPCRATTFAHRAAELGEHGAPTVALRSASWREHVLSSTNLGFMYETGRGVPQNYVAAAQWYFVAAQGGEPTAQFRLGLLYDKGHGVPQDFVEAHKWLNLAVAQAPSHDRDYWLRIRDAVAFKMSTTEIAEAQRRALLWRPLMAR